MLIKCGMLVLTIGATACGLLTLRQARLQAASELAQSQIRIGKSDERLWALRSQIAAQVTPSNVERMAQSMGPLRPIIAPPAVLPQPGESLPVLASSDAPDAALPPGVRVVVNTASSAPSAPTVNIGLVAKADVPSSPLDKVSKSKGDDKTATKGASKTATKAGAKGAVVSSPGGSSKAIKAKKPAPPADTLLRAQGKTPAARYAKAGKPTGAASGPTSKPASRPSLSPTQIAMQTGRQ